MLNHATKIDVVKKNKHLPVEWFVPAWLGATVVGSVPSTSPEQSLAKLTSSAVMQF